ncbi:MAG: DUF2703 domain-containing protein [Deltaproteobacteria bacterium]|nr:DUF2703 domain-containing protein [Deltaproteobacteria bacterium]
MKVIEVLYFDGCPGAEPALAAVKEVVRSLNLDDVEVRFVSVQAADAQRLRFLGSPSVRVDGVDVEPGADERDGFAMRCRVYAVDGRFQKVPPTMWIEAALTQTPRGAA